MRNKINKKYFAVITTYKIWSFGNDEKISYIEIFEKEKDAEECKNKKEKNIKILENIQIL